MLTSFTTVAFRYRLIGISEMIKFAEDAGFDGIEIWWPHILEPDSALKWKTALKETYLKPTMISIDSALTSTEDLYLKTKKNFQKAIQSAVEIECDLIRIFTGPPGSRLASNQHWDLFYSRLTELCNLAERDNKRIAIETHPNTLLDNPETVKKFLNEFNSKTAGLNLDVYHMWQSGMEVESLLVDDFLSRTFHMHLKNATSEEESIFSPANVYNPYSEGVEIRSLNEGKINYEPFCKKLHQLFPGPVSLEWFGADPGNACMKDVAFLKKCMDLQRIT